MRYRPFARTGIAVSVLSLELSGEDDKKKPGEWRELVHAAFEEGVNAFELVNPSPALLTGFTEGAEAVRRSLLFVGLRADAATEGAPLEAGVHAVIAQTRLGYLDLLTLGAGVTRSEDLLTAAIRLKDADVARRLAVAGAADDLLDDDIGTGLFEAVLTPYSLLSGWRDRNMVRNALEAQMGVIGCDPCPDELESLMETAQAKTKPGWFKPKPRPLAGVGTYAFLGSTRGWTAEQICLSYALAEPALATVQMAVRDRKHLSVLAATTDRDLPSQVSAQIEMARFSAEEAARQGAARRHA
jgi:aryl-alcohol dehydrogenase-like predicted oxidoreductase